MAWAWYVFLQKYHNLIMVTYTPTVVGPIQLYCIFIILKAPFLFPPSLHSSFYLPTENFPLF